MKMKMKIIKIKIIKIKIIKITTTGIMPCKAEKSFLSITKANHASGSGNKNIILPACQVECVK